MQSSSHHGLQQQQQPPPSNQQHQQQRYLPQGYGGPYPTYSAASETPGYAHHGIRAVAPYQPQQVDHLQQQQQQQQQQHQRQYAIPADPHPYHHPHQHQQQPLPSSSLPHPDRLRAGATRSRSRTSSSSQEPDDRAYDYDPSNGNGPLSAGTTVEDGNGSGRHANGGGGSNKRARVSVGQPVGPPLKRGNACNICRKRKLKCDGQRPVCGTCARLKHDCQYGDPAQERIAEKHRKLEERIQSLEAELEAYRAQGSPSTGSQPNTAFPSLNVPHTLPDPTGPDGALFYNGKGSANSQGDSYPQYSTQQLPVESPFIFPDANRPGAANGTHNGLALHQSPQDSVAYPLPPLSLSTSAAALYPPVSSAPSNGIGAAHLQSFPFAMNPTPQLSDLVNPSSANGAGVGAAVGSDTKAGILSTGTSATGQDFSNAHPYQQYGQDGTIVNVFGTDLPPLQVMLDLAEIYFTTLHQHLPFLHRRRFLYTLHNSASLAAAPSQSLVFSVLAIAAAYHDSPVIRSQGPLWYSKAREKVDLAISANVDPMSGSRVATLTVEMVQALCLLALIEMGQSDHQRAFLSLGQAVRIAAMLGLTRMDEDRVADRTGQMNEKRLRPPALHPLPDDPVLLEECRRTMCAVYVLDRFEAATVGWPAAIAEMDVRVLLPCADSDFENGHCEADGHNNPLWWPVDGAGTDPLQGWEGIRVELEAEGTAPLSAESATSSSGKVNGQQRTAGLPPVSTFGWLCRVVWLGSRVQAETYRASGPPPGGPWNRHVEMDPLTSPEEMVAMDRVIEFIRSKLSDSVTRKAQMGGGIDGSVVMILLILNCLITNLYHLRAASGLIRLPWDPSAPVHALGSSEFAMQRCWQALHSQHEILSRLTQYENAHTSLHQSRANTFTAFVPYVLYTIAFPAKFAIGDWTALVHSRDRSENVPAHLARDDLPSGDDAFPPSYFERRLAVVDVCCDAMDRIGEVWPVGRKFAMMVRGDRGRLAAQTYSRSTSAVQPHHAAPTTSPVRPVQNNGYNGHAAASHDGEY